MIIVITNLERNKKKNAVSHMNDRDGEILLESGVVLSLIASNVSCMW
jgi:hypothetical protein